jgi:site-specific DNA-methyltransferase (adenine-specific)
MERNSIICCNVLEEIEKMSDSFVDAVITSPPYFRQRQYTDKKEEIGREEIIEEYLEKILKVFYHCIRIIKPTGSIIFNIGDKYEKSDLMLIPYRFALEVKNKFPELTLINEITWAKTNPTPRQFNRRLVSAKEPFFHFVKSNNYYYDLDSFRENHQDKSNKINVGKSYFKKIEGSELTEDEKIVAKKELAEAIAEVHSGKISSIRMKIRGIHSLAFGGQSGGRNNQIINKGYSIIRVPGNSLASDVYYSSVENLKYTNHPAIYPLEIIEKLVLLTTPPNGLVFDPFIGSGTTALACKNTKRDYIGFDLSEEFVRLARERTKMIDY